MTIAYVVYKNVIKPSMRSVSTMSKADINDLVDVTEKAVECARDTVKDVIGVSPFIGPTDFLEDMIKPDFVSPIVDPIFDQIKPSHRNGSNTGGGRNEIRSFDEYGNWH